MKPLLTVLIALAILASLASCASRQSPDHNPNTKQAQRSHDQRMDRMR